MRSALPVVLDACVLIPMPLADTLLRLAAGPRLFLPKWSDQIMVEVIASSGDLRPICSKGHVPRERNQATFSRSVDRGLRKLILTMTNHPKDRHVLAVAVQAGAKLIVIYNTKDCPRSSLTPHSITVQGPSAFLKILYIA